jgi:hypothetical protein
VTKRLRILDAMAVLLSEITIANGYETNAGQALYIGAAPELSENDPPAGIAIVPQDAVTRENGPQWEVFPLDVQAIAYADLEQPWIAVELVIGDLKRAIERTDRTLGSILKGDLVRGSTKTLERLPGSKTVGAGVTYLCSFVEPWGNP